jgi:isopenicillin N synthase-like dioxygenase
MAAAANIPIIDLSGDQDQVARQLVEAAEEHGFIYIKNSGVDISPSEIDEAFQLVCNHHFSYRAYILLTKFSL